MSDNGDNKKSLTQFDPAVKKEIDEALRMTTGLKTQLKGLENKLKVLQKAGEDKG